MRHGWSGVLALAVSWQAVSACGGVEEKQDIFVAAELVDFGQVSVGEVLTLGVEVYNAGELPLVLEAALPPGADAAFSVGEHPPEVPPFQWVSVPVTYAPTAATAAFATLELVSDDPEEDILPVVLLGSAVPLGADVRLSPGLVDFGHVYVGETEVQPILIAVQGHDDLEILGEVAMAQGSAPGFSVTFSGAGAVVPSGTVALVEVRYAAPDLLQANGEVEIQTGDPYQPLLRVPVFANGAGSSDNTPPRVLVLEPTSLKTSYTFQTLEVEARVGDAEQPVDSLYVRLESLLDGVIEDEFPDESGLVRFEVDLRYVHLSPGTHTFVLTAIDAFDGRAQASFTALIDQSGPVGDGDADGYTWSTGDCDDGDPFIYPGAVEVADGVDQDCDDVVDEGTARFDDDGDGFSEDDGDCLDDDPGVAPGIAEVTDSLDNDCNGLVDDGTTRYDDDGDTVTEAQGDCDDAQFAVHPGAPERCDGLDNDCNGLLDDACLDDSIPVTVVGDRVLSDKSSVSTETELEVSVFVVASDVSALEYHWGADGGDFAATEGGTATWVAPAVAGYYTTWCQVVDPATGEDAWGFGEIRVVQPVATGGAGGGPGEGGCSTGGPALPRGPGVFALAAGALLVGRRRRGPRA